VSERRTKVNPSKTRRYEPKRRRNQERFVILDKSVRSLMTGRTATGVEGRESDAGHSFGTAGTRALMPREKLKRSKPRGESTEAGNWDGPTRMSVEDPVMGSEQRGRIRRSQLWKQLETG